MNPKFSIGQKVLYTNENGVFWGERTITGIERITYSKSGFGYYIEPTDTPWFAVCEETLKEKL